MNAIYEKDLDVDLRPVFLVVSEAGSVATAASRLHLTPPR
ncbi:helix-turn-helix domain-containing protein [Sorangium sp. So ce1151]